MHAPFSTHTYYTHKVWCSCSSTYKYDSTGFERLNDLRPDQTGRTFGNESCCSVIIFLFFVALALLPVRLTLFFFFFEKCSEHKEYLVSSAEWNGFSYSPPLQLFHCRPIRCTQTAFFCLDNQVGSCGSKVLPYSSPVFCCTEKTSNLMCNKIL